MARRMEAYVLWLSDQSMMTDFKDLDPETRAYALVGQFLQAWSAMELALRDAIGAGLDIEAVKLQIISSNLSFLYKVNILRTLVDVSFLSEDEKAQAKSKLQKLSEDLAKRNMIAHAPFRADATKTGVEFLTVKARGKFETPNIVWSPEQFAKEIDGLEGYTNAIDALQMRFKEKPLNEKSYADALVPFIQPQWPELMRRTMSPALLDAISQPDQSFLGSGQAAPQTSSPIPDKPSE